MIPKRKNGIVFTGPTLSPTEFRQFRELIHQEAGIKVSDAKQQLMNNRLRKRLKALNMDKFSEYFNFISTPKGRTDEMVHFLSAITTNQTHFFRENHHLETLSTQLVPIFMKDSPKRKMIRVWSAGCSSGQEPYSVAMVLQEALTDYPNVRIEILASDLDVNVLELAKSGVYSNAERKHIPIQYLDKYFTTTKESITVIPSIRRLVSFRHINLRSLNVSGSFDLIFCRNVIMYFEQSFRQQLAAYYYQKLNKPGFLFLGSSESFHRMPRIFSHKCFGRSILYAKDNASERRPTA